MGVMEYMLHDSKVFRVFMYAKMGNQDPKDQNRFNHENPKMGKHEKTITLILLCFPPFVLS